MTDTTETIVTPDPHAIARAVLLEVADESDQVGDFVTSYDLEDHVTDFRFAVNPWLRRMAMVGDAVSRRGDRLLDRQRILLDLH